MLPTKLVMVCSQGNSSHRQLVTSSIKGVTEIQVVSKDIPNFLSSMAELAARYTGTETVVADTNCIILERVRKVILTLSHGPDKYTDALLGTERLKVVLASHNRGFVT